MLSDREPIWNDTTLNLKGGDTTFEMCGWCQHRTGGVYRYDCMLKGGCQLSKSDYTTKYFDNACDIKLLGKLDIKSIIERKEREIKNNEEQIKRIKQHIHTLETLDFADDMPCLPDNRSHDHFNLDDEVMVFIRGEADFTPIKTGWLGGKVVPGYRHHDGCVSAYIYEKYHTGDYLDGHGYGSGYVIPLIMLKEEYEWFIENPMRFTDWIRLACEDKKFNGVIIDWMNIDIPK
ncbi:MAG: hypothetical protein WCS33_00165 [Candidatus Caldatribacteriota bacterium]